MARVDTIAAIATPPGRGGIGIVRVSGPRVAVIAATLIGELPPPRRAYRARFRDATGAVLDDGLALYFPAPNSFTGEDVLELHAHGSPVVLDLLLQALYVLGARAARPGEFSERAFHNGKLDLAQAEAVADLIASHSAAAARNALRSLRGEFSRAIHALVEALIQLRLYVESAIDFPEEEIDFLNEGGVATRVQAVRAQVEQVLVGARQGRALQEGLRVVIVGRPNAGKSSLLNRLAQTDAAIVSPVAGTTRDLLREQILIDGLPLHLIDTAGLRDTPDAVEREGVRRALAAATQADVALIVLDDTDPAPYDDLLASLPPALTRVTVFNKIDLSGRTPGANADGVAVSALTGAGIDTLRARLKEIAGLDGTAEGLFSARRRHVEALTRALTHIDNGARELSARRAGELLAEELRRAQTALGEITGEFTSDDLLGRIFASFCIGK